MRRAGRVFGMVSEIVGDGVFAINKPCGHSSAQVLRECQSHFTPSLYFKPMLEAAKKERLAEPRSQYNRRRDVKRSNQVKMGHGGTLDPLATGVLILGVGAATKQLLQFLDGTKTYEAVVLFGASTDTYDRVGRLITKRPYDHITKDMVLKELAGFKGKQSQTPPLYSALKMNGKPLYEYAREGKPIPREIPSREVDVLDIELVEWHEPGSHNHRWPTQEAEPAERNLAEQVWRIKKQQESSKERTPEEKAEDDKAAQAHEAQKRKFETRQDELITDKPKKRKRGANPALMSGALDALPAPVLSNKGLNLVPPPQDHDTPPPWSDEGPPACKVRLTVTSGYYVRSFCHDLGAKLGSAGIMAELCRVRQSDFTVGGINTLEFDDLAKGEHVWGPKIANMIARWNGEPEGHWPGPAADKPDAQGPRASPRAGSRSPPSGKRHSSPARGEASPRAVQAPANDVPEAKPQRHEDEKEWNGIED